MKRQQGGFTLIELIMVIVIIGVLAAVAVPQFVNLGGDARFASISGAHGAVRSASAIIHSAALARGETGATGSVTVEGGTVATVNGYIAGTVAALEDAVELGDYTVAAGTNDGEVDVTLGTCSFTYTEAADSTTPASVSAITGAVDGGC